MRTKNHKNIVFILIVLLAMGVSGYFILHYNIVIVDGDSMQPTYQNQQILLAHRNQLIHRNNIIVFDHDNHTIIKRVIGIPNDVIQMGDGIILINGVQVHPYTYHGDHQTIHLSQQEYFVIGDNHLNSTDSRHYGVISIQDIVGVIKPSGKV